MWFSKLPWALDLDKISPKSFFVAKSIQWPASLRPVWPRPFPHILPAFFSWTTAACKCCHMNLACQHAFVYNTMKRESTCFCEKEHGNKHLLFHGTGTSGISKQRRGVSALFYLSWCFLAFHSRDTGNPGPMQLLTSLKRLIIILFAKTSRHTFAENSLHTSAKGRPIDWGGHYTYIIGPNTIGSQCQQIVDIWWCLHVFSPSCLQFFKIPLSFWQLASLANPPTSLFNRPSSASVCGGAELPQLYDRSWHAA